jgi:hypothetical protein
MMDFLRSLYTMTEVYEGEFIELTYTPVALM